MVAAVLSASAGSLETETVNAIAVAIRLRRTRRAAQAQRALAVRLGGRRAGKTTLLRMIAGDLPVAAGTITRTGGLGVMRQFIGSIGDERTLADLAAAACDRRFGELSGGQQARFLVLLLELSGATLLLLDEPTDNLDLAPAEAPREGLAGYAGTVLAVTHDRWSPAPSTGSCSCAATARCGRPRNRSGTPAR